ncbi:MAG: hypothetical protein MI674_03370, partial [Cytophagales bacterium]|nr:hypothetical protein [Cytophagales bacterium]
MSNASSCQNHIFVLHLLLCYLGLLGDENARNCVSQNLALACFKSMGGNSNTALGFGQYHLAHFEWAKILQE